MISRSYTLKTTLVFSFIFFHIFDGVAQPDADRPKLSKTNINDDLTVRNSICVGFDCLNTGSEVFDDTTIKLKENNLRIKFEDTSNAPFPSTDWQITANESTSGGLNKFSIQDLTANRTPFTIEGAAITNALYVEADGDIGIGTSNPVLDLHIVTGNSPAMRLEQNATSGFTAQTWDIAGNEANFFIRDVTGGSTLPFRIRPGAKTSSIEIALNSNVGFGTSDPMESIHIVRNDEEAGILAESKYGDSSNFIKTSSGQNASGIFFDKDSYLAISSVQSSAELITNSHNSLIIKGVSSDEEGLVGIGILNPSEKLDVKGKVKYEGSVVATDANIMVMSEDFRDGLHAVMQLNPVVMEANGQGGTRKGQKTIGVIAQDLQKVSPKLVSEYKSKEQTSGMLSLELKEELTNEQTYLAIRDNELQYLLLNAIKEQQIMILELKKEIEMLKKNESLTSLNVIIPKLK